MDVALSVDGLQDSSKCSRAGLQAYMHNT
jgi:hypothetical protein